jgi:hypothetical protein
MPALVDGRVDNSAPAHPDVLSMVSAIEEGRFGRTEQRLRALYFFADKGSEECQGEQHAGAECQDSVR